MLRLLIFRAGLIAAPFAFWFAWRWWARRSGREMGATPWPWLFAGGAALFGVSLIATVALHRDNRGQTYVPARAAPDGRVIEGHFEETAPRPK